MIRSITVVFLAVAMLGLQMPINARQDSDFPPTVEDPDAPIEPDKSATTTVAEKSEFWQVRVGDRAAKVASYAATIDLVVLVPDEATFLAAISMWGFKDGRWPILIEDDIYAPMFIQRFHPQQVLRLPSVGAETLPTDEALRAKMLETIAWIWRNPVEGRDQSEAVDTGEYADPVAIYQQAGWLPPGVVLTSVSDPARLAAVTLAASYGQPLVFLEGDFGVADDTLGPIQWELLNSAVEELVRGTGFAYDTLNDDIDTITVVRQMAGRYRSSADSARILAVTDGLARQANGRRWGVAGWVYGSPARSVYVAMSSVFIRALSPLMFDTYGDDEKFAAYHLNTMPAVFQTMQMQPAFLDGDAASLSSWWTIFGSGFAGDAIFLNSNGAADQFALSGAAVGYSIDVPILLNPTWLYMVHNWSAQQPDEVNTIAGRFLENGAVAYVGAINEPSLEAFVPPGQLAERVKMGSPFLVSARFENALPWKVLTIGDPLATFKAKGKAKRIPDNFSPDWPAGTVDLAVLVGEQAAVANKSGAWAAFFDTCRKLDRDELALRYYRKNVRSILASGGGRLTAENLRALQTIIPTLFEKGSLEELALALAALPSEMRTRRGLDMLWSRANPQLVGLEDKGLVRILMSMLRMPMFYVDAARLAPTVARVFGETEAHSFLDRWNAKLAAENTAGRAVIEAARLVLTKESAADAVESGGK